MNIILIISNLLMLVRQVQKLECHFFIENTNKNQLITMRTQKPLIPSSLNYESPHESDTTFMNHNKLNNGPDAFHSGKDIQSYIFNSDSCGYLKKLFKMGIE